MKVLNPSPTMKAFILAALALALLLAQADMLLAQSRSSRAPVVSPNAGLREREWALTHIPDEVNKHFTREQVSLFKQLSEDFRQIQVINNQMMRAAWAGPELDYKFISNATAEIKKRANRLKDNLRLPDSKNDKDDRENQKSPEREQLKASLLLLDKSIMSFVKNPIFQRPEVVDVQLSVLARRDLKSIIDLSASIKKSAEQMSKTSKPPQ